MQGTSVRALAQLESDVCSHFGVTSWSDLGQGLSLLAALSSDAQLASAALGPGGAGAAASGGVSAEEVLHVMHAVAGGWSAGGERLAKGESSCTQDARL
jgi:hypothetical protein